MRVAAISSQVHELTQLSFACYSPMQCNASAELGLEQVYEGLKNKRSQQALWEAVCTLELPYSQAACRKFVAMRKASTSEIGLAQAYDGLTKKSQQALWECVRASRLPYSRVQCRKYAAGRRVCKNGQGLEKVYRSTMGTSQTALFNAARGLGYRRWECRDYVAWIKSMRSRHQKRQQKRDLSGADDLL